MTKRAIQFAWAAFALLLALLAIGAAKAGDAWATALFALILGICSGHVIGKGRG